MNTVKKDYSMLPGVSLKGVELFFLFTLSTCFYSLRNI